jgi:hypothetical protein
MSEKFLSGGLDTVMNLFSKNDNNSYENSLQDTIISFFVANLISSKIDLDKINSIASIVEPIVMSFITNRNEETDENNSSSILDMFGRDKDHDALRVAKPFRRVI